jgi:hypothetical protein
MEEPLRAINNINHTHRRISIQCRTLRTLSWAGWELMLEEKIGRKLRKRRRQSKSMQGT